MPKRFIVFALSLLFVACTGNQVSSAFEAPPEDTLPQSTASQVSILSSSVSKNPLIAGQAQLISVTLTSTAAMQGLIVDIRVYDSLNNRYARKEFSPVNIPAGSQQVLTFDFQSPPDMPSGQYNVQVGVWNTAWDTLLYETRNQFTVNGPTATPKVSIVSSSVSKNPLVAGQAQLISVTLTSTAAVQGLIVDIRVYDSLNNRYARKEFSPVNIPAGSQQVLTFDFQSPPDMPSGQYNVQVGAWNTVWDTLLYETRNQFTVGGRSFEMNCDNEAWLVAGSYAVQNNQWGRGEPPPENYSQCVANGGVAGDGSVSARWTWTWPPGPNEIKAYPALVFGQKPGYVKTPNSNLPMRLDAVSQVTSAWSTRSSYTGTGQLTFDLWLTRDPIPRSFPETPITHEIMVAVEPYNGYGSGSPGFVEEIVISGVRYRVHKTDIFPPGEGQKWRFLVFKMQTPMVSGSLDFKPLFDYLKSRGFIQGSEYLSSIELGSEVEEGSGDVTVDSFKTIVR